MKNLILLAMVIGLFTVGTARADGAWVLWCHDLGDNSWAIWGAYPTYSSCKKAVESHCQSFGKDCYEGTDRDRIVIMAKDEKSATVGDIMCLPESVDQRK